MKYQFSFIEINNRLGVRKNRTETLDLDPMFYDHYDVGGMIKAFRARRSRFAYHDSELVVRSIKVGRATFKL